MFSSVLHSHFIFTFLTLSGTHIITLSLCQSPCPPMPLPCSKFNFFLLNCCTVGLAAWCSLPYPQMSWSTVSNNDKHDFCSDICSLLPCIIFSLSPSLYLCLSSMLSLKPFAISWLEESTLFIFREATWWREKEEEEKERGGVLSDCLPGLADSQAGKQGDTMSLLSPHLLPTPPTCPSQRRLASPPNPLSTLAGRTNSTQEPQRQIKHDKMSQLWAWSVQGDCSRGAGLCALFDLYGN